MRNGIISAGALLAMTAGVIIAQSATQETSNVLNAAKAGGQAESSKIARERSTDSATLDGLAQQAQRALAQGSDNAQQNKLAADGRKLEDTLKTLSPEAAKLLTQSSAQPAMRAPDPDSAAVVKTAPAVPAPAPKAGPVAADEKKDDKPGEPPAKKDNNVHINSQGAAYFDSKEAIGVFTDDVVVNHPGFQLFCEQLEVYMLKDDEKKKIEEDQQKKQQQQPPAAKPGGAAISLPATGTPALAGGGVLTSTTAARTGNPDEVAPAAAPVAKPADATPEEKGAQPDSNIRQAIARGPKVVIVKNTETGEQQIGVCRTATYIGENGDIIMRDMPLVQRGNHVHYATDPSTYMIIKQDGKLHTFGPAKVDIIEEKEKKPAAPGAAVATPTPTPPGPAKPAAKPAKPPGGKKGKL